MDTMLGSLICNVWSIEELLHQYLTNNKFKQKFQCKYCLLTKMDIDDIQDATNP